MKDMELISSIMRAFMFLGFFSIFVGLLILTLNRFIRLGRSTNRISFLAFALGVILFVSGYYVSNRYKDQIISSYRKFVDNKKDEIKVIVNTFEINNSDIFLGYLDRLETDLYHHSHPTQITIWVELSTKDENWNLKLRRDSEYGEEFWIYIYTTKSRKDFELGKIRSKDFLKYLNSLQISSIKYNDY